MTTFTAISTNAIATSLMLAGNPFVEPRDRYQLSAHLVRAGQQSFCASMRPVSRAIWHAGWVRGSLERSHGGTAMRRSPWCSCSLSKHSMEIATR